MHSLHVGKTQFETLEGDNDQLVLEVSKKMQKFWMEACIHDVTKLLNSDTVFNFFFTMVSLSKRLRNKSNKKTKNGVF